MSRKTNVIPFHPFSFHPSFSLTHIHCHTSVSTIPRNTPIPPPPCQGLERLALQRTGMPGARSALTHKHTHRGHAHSLMASLNMPHASVSSLVCGDHVRFVCECNSSSTTRVCFPLLRWTADSAACGVSVLSWTLRPCVCVCVWPLCTLFAPRSRVQTNHPLPGTAKSSNSA